MTEEQINELQKFLEKNKGKISQPVKQYRTTFDIMKQPHLENVWSNIYAFYFNPEEEHNFGNLFLKSIIELIKEKDNGRDITPMQEQRIDIKTEDCTEEQKRLDIILQYDNYAILIENKVKANLYNNLGKYWNNYDYIENKQGVVISLYPQTISLDGEGDKLGHDPANWVNITHSELINRVNKNISFYPHNKKDRYFVFYKEFHQNVLNMTIPIDKSSFDFYWKNRKTMEQLNSLVCKIKDNIKEQIKESMKWKDFPGSYELNHCSGLYFFQDDTKKGRSKQHCVISVFCNKLYEEKPTISITVEILGKNFIQKCIDNLANLKQYFPNSKNPKLSSILKIDRLNTNNDWEEISKPIIKKISQKDLQRIGEIVQEIVFKEPISKEYPEITIYYIYKQLDQFYKTAIDKTV